MYAMNRCRAQGSTDTEFLLSPVHPLSSDSIEALELFGSNLSSFLDQFGLFAGGLCEGCAGGAQNKKRYGNSSHDLAFASPIPLPKACHVRGISKTISRVRVRFRDKSCETGQSFLEFGDSELD